MTTKIKKINPSCFGTAIYDCFKECDYYSECLRETIHRAYAELKGVKYDNK